MQASNNLDAYVQRFQQFFQPFNIHRLNGDDSNPVPWFDVTVQHALHELVLDTMEIPRQVSSIGMQIATWGRFEAIAKRIWEVEERRYRQWRDKAHLAVVEEAEKQKAKKPSDKTIEAMVRQLDDYPIRKAACERAEEAYLATVRLVEGLRAKRDVLIAYAPLFREQSRP